MAKVLVADPLHNVGQELLLQETEVEIATGLTEDELISRISEYDGLVVRSETQVTKAVLQAGISLRVVARAGVGVDNIDLAYNCVIVSLGTQYSSSLSVIAVQGME